MSFDYSKLRATATRLLTDKGLACTLRKKTVGAYNPATGSVTTATTDYAIVGVLLNYSKSLINDTDSLIQVNDRKAIIQGDIAPDTDDEFIFNGTIYRIISVKITNPAGLAVIYELQLRV